MYIEYTYKIKFLYTTGNIMQILDVSKSILKYILLEIQQYTKHNDEIKIKSTNIYLIK